MTIVYYKRQGEKQRGTITLTSNSYAQLNPKNKKEVDIIQLTQKYQLWEMTAGDAEKWVSAIN